MAWKNYHRPSGKTTFTKDEPSIPDEPSVLLGRFPVDAFVEAFDRLGGHRTLQTRPIHDASNETRTTTVFPILTEFDDGIVDRLLSLLFLRRSQLGTQQDHLIGFLYDPVMFCQFDAVPIRERIGLMRRTAPRMRRTAATVERRAGALEEKENR